jgi:hypothetical protein
MAPAPAARPAPVGEETVRTNAITATTRPVPVPVGENTVRTTPAPPAEGDVPEETTRTMAVQGEITRVAPAPRR